MELPIAPQSYQPSAEALLRAAKRARIILARMVADETQLDSATVFTNPDRSQIHLANFAVDLRLPENTAAQDACDEVAQHFAQRGCPCHCWDSNDLAWPQEIAQQLEAQGYRPTTQHLYLLNRFTPPGRINDQLQIIPARSAYNQLPQFFREMATQEFNADPQLAGDYAQVMIDQLDEPRLELFLGRLDGQSVGIAGVITLGQIGVIYPAYTDNHHRGRGIAATLMSHTLDHCARALMDQVILERPDGCPSIGFYESLGFQAVTTYTQYRRP